MVSDDGPTACANCGLSAMPGFLLCPACAAAQPDSIDDVDPCAPPWPSLDPDGPDPAGFDWDAYL